MLSGGGLDPGLGVVQLAATLASSEKAARLAMASSQVAGWALSRMGREVAVACSTALFIIWRRAAFWHSRWGVH